MKKIFTLFVFGLITFIARAGHNDGKISITSLSMQPVRVEIDGVSYNTRDHMVIINHMAPGHHIIRIYRLNGINYQGNKQNNNYRQVRDMIYADNIRLMPGYHLDIVINRFGKALVDQEYMDEIYDRQYGRDYGDAWFREDWNDHHDDHHNVDRKEEQPKKVVIQPMNDQSFDAMKTALQKEIFESTRLKLARQSIQENYFTVVQVKQLMQLFTYDQNRLEIAKSMYGNTIDKEDYIQVYELISFSNRKEELANYISNYKNP